MDDFNNYRGDILDLILKRKELESLHPQMVKSLNDFRKTFAKFREVQDQYNGKSVQVTKSTVKYKA